MQKVIDPFLEKLESASDSEATEQDERTTASADLLESLGLEWYDLREAISDDDTTKLSSLLKMSPRLANYVLPYAQGHHSETTLLMEAIDNQNLNAVQLLLASGADVKAQTESYHSALQVAAEQGDVEITKLLLRSSADPTFPRSGKTPLREAVLAGHFDVAKLLVDAGAPRDFFSAVAWGDIESVRKSLSADPSLVSRPDGAARMPMDYAVANGRFEIASLLLKSGAPVVTETFVLGDSPLHRAIRRLDATMVKLLLDSGSSPDTSVRGPGEDPERNPAVHLAVELASVEILDELLSHKADLDRRDTYSKTVLHVAAGAGRTEIVERLIKAGAKVNARQLGFSLPCGSSSDEKPSQNTPLHYAAAKGNPETIKALLKGGAELEATNVHGITPLMSTVDPPLYTGINEKSRLANIECLVEAGANINAPDKQGRTILDAAQAELSNEDRFEGTDLKEVVALLQKHGAKTGGPAATKKVRSF
jgi:ankyrin repeat protein